MCHLERPCSWPSPSRGVLTSQSITGRVRERAASCHEDRSQEALPLIILATGPLSLADYPFGK